MPQIRIEVAELHCVDDEEVEDEIYWYHCLERRHGVPPAVDGGSPEMPIILGHAYRGNQQPVDIDDGDTYVPPPGTAILYQGRCGNVAGGVEEAESHHQGEHPPDEIAGSIYLFEEDDEDERPGSFSTDGSLVTRFGFSVMSTFGFFGALLIFVVLSPIIFLVGLVELIFPDLSDRPDYLGGVGVRIPCAGPQEEFRTYRFTGSSTGATFLFTVFNFPWITDHGRAEYVMKVRIVRS
jgi:hypothetical protein